MLRQAAGHPATQLQPIPPGLDPTPPRDHGKKGEPKRGNLQSHFGGNFRKVAAPQVIPAGPVGVRNEFTFRRHGTCETLFMIAIRIPGTGERLYLDEYYCDSCKKWCRTGYREHPDTAYSSNMIAHYRRCNKTMETAAGAPIAADVTPESVTQVERFFDQSNLRVKMWVIAHHAAFRTVDSSDFRLMTLSNMSRHAMSSHCHEDRLKMVEQINSARVRARDPSTGRRGANRCCRSEEGSVAQGREFHRGPAQAEDGSRRYSASAERRRN